jgi:hypothetical protein
MGGGFFTSMFGGGRECTSECQPPPEPVETDHNRLEPLATDDLQLDSHWQTPTRRWVPPAEHAAAILEFSQGHGGRTGSIPWDELQKLHIEICAERDWDPIGWTAVGRELGDLLKEEKKTYENGKRVYRIPPIAGRTRLRAV